eukprot:1150267-Pelagomonas_calceolata.AAC.3
MAEPHTIWPETLEPLTLQIGTAKPHTQWRDTASSLTHLSHAHCGYSTPRGNLRTTFMPWLHLWE